MTNKGKKSSEPTPTPKHDGPPYNVYRTDDRRGFSMRVDSAAFDVTLPAENEDETSFAWNRDGSNIDQEEEPDFQVKLKYGSKGNLQLRVVPSKARKTKDVMCHVQLFNATGCCGAAYLWRRVPKTEGAKVRRMVAKNIVRKADIGTESTFKCKVVFPPCNTNGTFRGPFAFTDPSRVEEDRDPDDQGSKYVSDSGQASDRPSPESSKKSGQKSTEDKPDSTKPPKDRKNEGHKEKDGKDEKEQEQKQEQEETSGAASKCKYKKIVEVTDEDDKLMFQSEESDSGMLVWK
ncbi:hypothetical protein BGW39_004841, partial [Mortierella sp. 14UC]